MARSRRKTTKPASKTPTAQDCQTCGACCILPLLYGDEASHVDLTEEDAERLPKRLQYWNGHHFSGRWTMRSKTTRALVVLDNDEMPAHVTQRARLRTAVTCVALKGTAGKSCSCSVYADRPRACAMFTPGGEGCLDARRQIGL